MQKQLFDYTEDEIQRMKDEALRLHLVTLIKRGEVDQLKAESKMIDETIKQAVQQRDIIVLTLKDAGIILEYEGDKANL